MCIAAMVEAAAVIGAEVEIDAAVVVDAVVAAGAGAGVDADVGEGEDEGADGRHLVYWVDGATAEQEVRHRGCCQEEVAHP